MTDAGTSAEMNRNSGIPDELKALSIHTVFADPRDRGELAAVIERLEALRDSLPLGHEEATAILLVTTEALRLLRRRRRCDSAGTEACRTQWIHCDRPRNRLRCSAPPW